MKRAEELAVAFVKKAKDGVFDLSKVEDVVTFAMEKLDIYACSGCKDIFPLRKMCGAAGDEDGAADDDKVYCPSCTKVGSVSLGLSVATAKKQSKSVEKYYACDSEDNCLAQQLELEVVAAMYGEELCVVVEPPSKPGQQCMKLKVRAPKLYSLESADPVEMQSMKDFSVKLLSQVSFTFTMTSNYPSSSTAEVMISTGNLSLMELDCWTTDALTEALKKAAKDSDGAPCVVNCLQAFTDWFYNYQLKADRVAARKHRLFIIDNIFTLHCPRCSLAIFDFSGCFALNCANEACNAGICAWCLKDCGADAHAHVLNCRDGNKQYFGKFADFLLCQNAKRARKTLDYMQGSVLKRRWNLVWKFLEKDLQDLGMSVVDVQKGNVTFERSYQEYEDEDFDEDDLAALGFGDEDDEDVI